MLDLSKLRPSLKGTATCSVDSARMATNVGSGAVEVFATPMMIALMEAAAVDCVEHLLPEGHVSLGTHLDVAHTAPTPPGFKVTATAELTEVDGRVLTFAVSCADDTEVVGRGTHTRVIVDRKRLETRLGAKVPRT